MTAAEVTVQRLRLRSRVAVPGLLPNVEDALRVSTKPAALLNRLVLVRRLRLRAAAGASAQALALHLERAWQRLAAQAQPLDAASDTAEAVWAPSLALARQTLLRRWLRGEATEAWFWQRLAPPRQSGAWPVRALALMLTAAEDAAPTNSVGHAGGPALQVRAMLNLIAEHRLAAQFVEAITEQQALAVLGWIETADEPPAIARRWLHASPSAPRVAAACARLLELMNAISTGVESSPVEYGTPPPTELAHPVAATSTQATHLGEAAAMARRLPMAGATTAIERRAPAAVEPHAALSHRLVSPWSGLWLLLPMLLRHGLDDADDPLAAWAGAMRAACRGLRIPEDDPIHAALAGLDLPTAECPQWLRTARLAAVHDARLPLLRIARRHGAAWVSPERIDIEFPAASLHLRIRRAGFDINPGFVPWLGRIVHFHYPS